MKKVSNKTVATILVTYNRKTILVESIKKLLSSTYKNNVILVVDNASTDGTYDCIKNLIDDKKVIYINTKKNIGGAGGFSYGIEYAYKNLDADYYWLMDDDCLVNNDSLEKLIIAANRLDDNFGFLSSLVLWKDGKICEMNKQKIKKPWHKKGEYLQYSLLPVYHATFVSFFIKKRMVEEIGLPIKEFFIWGDDVEFSNRISKKYDCYVVGDSIVEHATNNNSGSNIATDSKERIGRYKYAYRNETYIAKKNNKRIRQWLKINLHICRVLRSSQGSKLRKIAIIVASSVKGIFFNPTIKYLERKNNMMVLQAFGEPLSMGGQESFVMNTYEAIDRDKVQFDFCTPYELINIKMRDKIEEMGGRVFYGNNEFYSKTRKKSLVKYYKDFFKHNKYEVVHIHSGSIFNLATIAKFAKKSGAKKVIVHSHATGHENLKHKISKALYARPLLKYATDYLACSKDAAGWKYPNKIMNDNKYVIVKNGIDTNRFKYDEKARIRTRKALKIDDKTFVIVHVGRFTEEKNHAFIIDVFEELLKLNKNSQLLLVGEGPLQDEIKQMSKEKGVYDKINFLGNRSDVQDILSASDCFIFPSKFEGLGISAIEAQCSGLKVYCASILPKEIDITDSVIRKDLNEEPSTWAKIIHKNGISEKRGDSYKAVIKNGYDSKDNSSIIEAIYETNYKTKE